MGRNATVDAWFDRYQNRMKDVVQRLRAIVLDADSRIDECIKWQAPTFTYKGNLASFYPKSNQHASLMFHTGAKIPGKHPRLEGTGDTSRVLKVGSLEDANAAQRDIERIVKAWCEWRDAESQGHKADQAVSKKARPVKSRSSAGKNEHVDRQKSSVPLPASTLRRTRRTPGACSEAFGR